VSAPDLIVINEAYLDLRRQQQGLAVFPRVTWGDICYRAPFPENSILWFIFFARTAILEVIAVKGVATP
jgi:hypothetical protein